MAGLNVPKPPKPGEIMICQFCGKPMLPKDFSKDPFERKQEFKWQTHWACREAALHQLDVDTGIVVDRAKGINLGNAAQLFSKRTRTTKGVIGERSWLDENGNLINDVTKPQ